LSFELPEDLKPDFFNFENQAMSLLRNGKYELAERLYKMLLDIILNKQLKIDRRIHKGSIYHMLGFSLALQKNLCDALHNFVLAYIEDTLSTPMEQENAADSAPAGNVLIKGFHLDEAVLQQIKELAKKNKAENITIYNPEKPLADLGIPDLLTQCNPQPQVKDITNVLIVTLTPRAQKTWQENVSKISEKIIQIARALAKEREHAEITEDDINDAIEKMEGEQ